MMNYLLVFIGGGLGSICRYGIAHALSNYKSQFPWGTFIANVLSCILLGALVGLMLKSNLSSNLKYLLVIGFCGGFSTFSTFSNETFQLFSSGQFTTAFVNIFLSLIVCLFCIYLGMRITQ